LGIVLQDSTQSSTGLITGSNVSTSTSQCTDGYALQGDALCQGDGHKIFDLNLTSQECCAACDVDSECVQWGRYGGSGTEPSVCFLSSTKSASEHKLGSTCGQKKAGSDTALVV